MTDFNFVCGHCLSENTYRITAWKGKAVVPDPIYDLESGIVVKCRACNDITGYLIHMTGVIDAECVD